MAYQVIRINFYKYTKMNMPISHFIKLYTKSLLGPQEVHLKAVVFHPLKQLKHETTVWASLTMLKALTVRITTNWKILQEKGIPDYLSCLLRNLYAGHEATVRTRHGTMDWFKTGKRIHQGCILLPCLFNLYAEYIMWNAGLGWSTTQNQDCWEKYQ